MKIVLSKHVVLIMQIINIIINMDEIIQERSNKGSILNSDKRLKYASLNKKFGTHVKESIPFQVSKN